MEDRNYTLDIVKGLGIIFVVFGHSKLGSEMYRVIFSFHIQLFFFVSGYVFSLKDNLKNFISKKISALKKSYFILINTLNLKIYISKIIAVFIAIIFPLIMLFFVKKYKFLSSLFLQKKGISK